MAFSGNGPEVKRGGRRQGWGFAKEMTLMVLMETWSHERETETLSETHDVTLLQ